MVQRVDEGDDVGGGIGQGHGLAHAFEIMLIANPFGRVRLFELQDATFDAGRLCALFGQEAHHGAVAAADIDGMTALQRDRLGQRLTGGLAGQGVGHAGHSCC